MGWEFADLPDGVLSVIDKNNKNLYLNASYCPDCQKRPCKNAGSCCLGKIRCPHGKKCYNVIEDTGKGDCVCEAILESAAIAGK